MAPLKERIPDEVALAALVEEQLPEVERAVRDAVGSQEEEYVRARFGSAAVTTTIVVVFAGIYGLLNFNELFPFLSYPAFLPSIPEDTASFSVILLYVFGVFSLILAPVVIAGLYLKRLARITRRFNTALDTVVFPAALHSIGYSGTFLDGHNDVVTQPPWYSSILRRPVVLSPGRQQVLDLLTRSALITDYDQLRNETNFTFSFDNRSVLCAELQALKWVGAGKSRRLERIFNGYFLSFQLERSLQGVTYVTADNDRTGFASRSLWNRFFATNGAVKETVLEWNDFENLLHVATTNEAEARYILTPDFMAELHDWWLSTHTMTRIVFAQGRVYILLSDPRIQLDTTIAKINQESLREYLLSITRPLLRVGYLIEKIHLR